MFERYNEQARRLLFFSRYEASQFGMIAIESEHVLLGLLREGGGPVAAILASRGVTLDRVRDELERTQTPREKISTSVEIPFSPETKRILQYAAEEADRLRNEHIGPEHMLLAILREEQSKAAKLLAGYGLRLDELRDWFGTSPSRAVFTSRTTVDASVQSTHGPRDAQIDEIKTLLQTYVSMPRDSREALETLALIFESLESLKG